MHIERKNSGGSRLVVVFEEPHRVPHEIRVGVQVPSHGVGIAVAQAIVEPLVVREIESLLLQVPFAIPICLGQESEFRVLGFNGLDRLGPPWVVDGR